jgi:hypothetical protein
MIALAGPWTIVTGLLLLGGALKTAQPADTARALEALGVHASKPMVRAGGGAEVGTAVVAPLPGLASIVADQPAWGMPFLFLGVVGVYVVFLMLSALPRVFADPGAT